MPRDLDAIDVQSFLSDPILTGLMPEVSVDPAQTIPDPALVQHWGAEAAARSGLVPWRVMGGRTIVLSPSIGQFRAHKNALSQAFGTVRMAQAAAEPLVAATQRTTGGALIDRAETRPKPDHSCRDMDGGLGIKARALIIAVLAAMVAAPAVALVVLTALAVAASVTGTAMKIAAALLGRPPAPAPAPAQLPRISLMVPLFKEPEIASDLIDRLMALDYPDEQLEICFVVEESDMMTRHALARAALSKRFRYIIVPPGRCQTKPRALNYALDFMKGDVIGVLDAEDAPEPDQLRRVAGAFAAAGPEVACVQGALDFYNSRFNWMSRCFTIEYASWFRVVLPGLERMGLMLPLGGTTVYLRRSALEQVGAWDAQNVTEDADLGIRLVRHGYRTRMIPTTTFEEANARPMSWVKQRSRWLKGYAVTYLVHMRRPLKLMREVGLWRFAGFQVQFLGTLITFTLAPLLWSLVLGATALGHPAVTVMPGGFAGLAGLFILTESTGLIVGALALIRARKAQLALWLPAMMVYYPLATMAAYKALWELVRDPFYWDKTTHGEFSSNG